MTRTLTGLTLVALVLIVVVLSAAGVAAQANSDPTAVMAAFEAARDRGDIDAALAYFADDATVTQRATVYTGKDEIRKYLQGAIARVRSVQVTNRRLSGIQLSWQERPTPGQGASPFEVSVQAVVYDGKIKALVYNGGQLPLRGDAALDTRGQLPAVVGLGSVLLVMGGVLLVASTSVGRGGLPPSRLQGRMMNDLRGWSAGSRLRPS